MRAVITQHDDPTVVGSQVVAIEDYPSGLDLRVGPEHHHAVVVRIAGGRVVDSWSDRIEVQR